MFEVKTPKITGGVTVAAWYSYAPMSVLAPCGRLFPSISTTTLEMFTPESIPGPPDCT
jgi:hypothetical protein